MYMWQGIPQSMNPLHCDLLTSLVALCCCGLFELFVFLLTIGIFAAVLSFLHFIIQCSCIYAADTHIRCEFTACKINPDPNNE